MGISRLSGAKIGHNRKTKFTNFVWIKSLKYR